MEEHAMATLNIKNFPDSLYAQLQERAEREHRSLAQQVVHLLEESSGKPKLHSFALPGEGEERYVITIRKERDTPSGYPRRVGLAKSRPVG